MITSEPVHTSNKSAVFLDRDGVINEEVSYCHTIEDFNFVSNIDTLLKMLQTRFDKMFIVTNQAGIGRGYYTEKQYDKLTDWMLSELQKKGIEIEAVFHCPHHPEGLPPYNISCECRKPMPGMINQAIETFDIDPERSILIGDKISDIHAANNAGLAKAILVGTGHSVTSVCMSSADYYYPSLCDFISDIDLVCDIQARTG